MSSTIVKATAERTSDLLANLSSIRASVSSSATVSSPTLVAVSKYKPSSDILACYEQGGQLDFGENYVQELQEKATELPADIRWHFIGTLQSNKVKALASIPNLYAIQTLTSEKAAAGLEKALGPEREQNPLNVLIQVNTSGELAKSGLSPTVDEHSDLGKLAKFVVSSCPKLRLQGLMTIGALEVSLGTAETDENKDFELLRAARDSCHEFLMTQFSADQQGVRWGNADGKLLLSMGMSSDFQTALKMGSDIVRVGTGIFGERQIKK